MSTLQNTLDSTNTSLLDGIFQAIDEENDKSLYSLLTVIPDIDSVHHELGIGIIHVASAIPCTKFARELFRNLVKWKVDVNATTVEGYTAIDIAVANNRLQTVKFLLKNRAQACDRTLELAQEFHNTDCEKLVRESLAMSAEGYDTEVLVSELKRLGLNPGPITRTTKPVYLRYRDRHKLKDGSASSSPSVQSTTAITQTHLHVHSRVYSPELELLLSKQKLDDFHATLVKYDQLDEQLAQFFLARPASHARICFTYLLLDARITKNLPKRENQMKPLELFRTFLDAVFYVGKGTNARPYAHLHEAKVALEKSLRPKNDKTRKILSLWTAGVGVICLSAFRNVSSDEALSREAAMISALDLHNLTNEIESKFARELKWSGKDRSRLGTALLYRCFRIHMSEGERPLLDTHVT